MTVSGITNAVQVVAGYSHSCALLNDSTLKCWGDNTLQKLGDGTTTTRNSPVAVTVLSSVSSAILNTVTSVSAGGHTTCAVLNDGTVECWGEGSTGELGDATILDDTIPGAVTGLSNSARQ